MRSLRTVFVDNQLEYRQARIQRAQEKRKVCDRTDCSVKAEHVWNRLRANVGTSVKFAVYS